MDLTVHIDGLIFGLQKWGGISRVSSNLLHALGRRRDLRVHLYLPTTSVAPSDFPGSIKTIVYPSVLGFRPARYFGRLNEERRLAAVDAMWSKPTCGVFHSTFYSTYGTLRIPQVLTLQDMIYERFPECFEKNKWRIHVEEKLRCSEAAAAIACPSGSAMTDAEESYNLKGKIKKVIPYAIETSFRPVKRKEQTDAFRLKYTEGNPYVLCVGARMGHKNFIGLLAAYSRWKSRKKYRLLAVGGGAPSVSELSAARCLGLDGLVHYGNELDEEGLVLAYNSAQALVVPALYEGFGFPVLEALACGTPVASSRGGSLPEVGGTIPVYFDPQESDRIVEALDNVVEVSRESERVKAGIHRARERTWDSVAEEYVQVYQSVAK